MFERRSSGPVGASTFLSHSSADGELVVGAIRVLESHGAAVYVDKKDGSLPPYTDKSTAKILKNRISESQKFVLLASEQSKDSRWVPWELGLADGYKGLGNVAIFPAVESKGRDAWTNWEYLGLYDRIIWGDHDSYSGKIWMVIHGDSYTATELGKWLTSVR
ncbi:MAG: TIR domain-containing protein [Erythrobacter sp.]|nr:TIR domain-containing protein [Erythrobacter sp.]NCQ62330.1 TIR domain-containing protein [Alphaproteobacteria bacterium]